MIGQGIAHKVKGWLRFVAWPCVAATVATVVMLVMVLIRDIEIVWHIVAGLWLSYWGVGALTWSVLIRAGVVR
jgi:hypothetical protein